MGPTRAALLLLALISSAARPGWPSTAAASARRVAPDPRLEILKGWVTASGLGNYLEVVQLRRIPHPLRRDQSPVQGLELRAKPIGEIPLSALNRRFEREHGVSLWEKLFYKFVHVFEIPPDSGVVVLLDKWSIFADSSGKVRTLAISVNMVRRDLVVPDSAVPSLIASSGRAKDVVDTTKRISTERIRAFLTRQFPRKISSLKIIEQTDHTLDATIDDLRGVVVRNPRRWERLQLSFALVLGGNATTIVVHADGQRAAGVGNQPPGDEAFQDMEPRYTRQLSDFLGELVDKLRTFLTRAG